MGFTTSFEDLTEASAGLPRDLVEAEWHGVPVWPVVRMSLMRRLGAVHAGLPADDTALITRNRLRSLFGTSFGLIAHRPGNVAKPSAEPTALAIVTRGIAQTIPGSPTEDGDLWHPTVEKLAHLRAHDAKASPMILYWPDARSASDLAGIHLPAATNIFGRVDTIVSVLKGVAHRRDRALARYVDPIVSHMESRLTGEIGFQTSSLYADLAAVRFWRDFFSRKLRAWNVGRLYFQCYYTRQGVGAVLAARDAGVTAVDVQHGLGGPLHYAYSWRGAPANAERVFPQEFYVWSQLDAESIATNIEFETKARVVGPNWGKWLLSHRTLASRLSAEPGSSGNPSPGKLIVYMLARNEAATVAEQVRAVLPAGYTLAVRGHPIDHARTNGTLTAVDQWANSQWLPSLLSRASGVVGAHSAACVEAAMWPVPTLVLGRKAKHLFAGYLSLPNLSWGDSADESLQGWLSKAVRQEKSPPG